MSWKAAPACNAVLSQANARWPNRDKSSDGIIGDAAHSSRSSDHNPNPAGLVMAVDLTHDPAHGVDCAAIFAAIKSAQDPRVKYIIHNRRIVSSQTRPWQERAYGGSNAHTGHMHVSVVTHQANNVNPWPGIGTGTSAPPVTPPSPPASGRPTLRMGDKGNAVGDMQVALNRFGYKLHVDHDFGKKTRWALVRFQATHRLVPDGICGPKTWAKLGG
jgi:hypothetical protein